MPAVRGAVTMECAGNGRALLDPRAGQPAVAARGGRHRGVDRRAAVRRCSRRRVCADDAVEVAVHRASTAGSRAASSRPTSAACRSPTRWRRRAARVRLNGAPLPPQHGFPLRLVVPGWYGIRASSGWRGIDLRRRAVQRLPADASATACRAERRPGHAVTRMMPRSLMVPPGDPGLHVAPRHLAAGPVHACGPGVVGLGADRGRRGLGRRRRVAGPPAVLGEPPPAGAWRAWAFAWDAEPGSTSCARARATRPATRQPVEAAWNVGGYANNAVHRVPVTVTLTPTARRAGAMKAVGASRVRPTRPARARGRPRPGAGRGRGRARRRAREHHVRRDADPRRPPARGRDGARAAGHPRQRGRRRALRRRARAAAAATPSASPSPREALIPVPDGARACRRPWRCWPTAARPPG